MRAHARVRVRVLGVGDAGDPFLGVHRSHDGFTTTPDGDIDVVGKIGGVPLGLAIADDIFDTGMMGGHHMGAPQARKSRHRRLFRACPSHSGQWRERDVGDPSPAIRPSRPDTYLSSGRPS